MPVAQPWRARTMFPGLVAALEAQATAVQLLPFSDRLTVKNLLTGRTFRQIPFTWCTLDSDTLWLRHLVRLLSMTTPCMVGSRLPTVWTPPSRRFDITTHPMLVRMRWNRRLPVLLSPTDRGMPAVLVQNTVSLLTTYVPCFLSSKVTPLFPCIFSDTRLVFLLQMRL